MTKEEIEDWIEENDIVIWEQREKIVLIDVLKMFYESHKKQLSIPAVVGRSEQCCSPTDGFYLGTTCPHCNKPFRKDIK